MAGSWALESARRDLDRLSGAGLGSRALRTEYLRTLRRLIPFESAWFAMADPATLLFTDALREGMPGHATPRFVEDEFLLDDFNKWVDLARAPLHANGLELAGGGDLRASHRFREILQPLGFGDELRASLISCGACWGFICLHRAQGDRSFRAEDAAWLASLAPVMAAGLRRSLLLHTTTAESDHIGVVLLADDLSLMGMSGHAERWLAEISDDDWPSQHQLPPVLIGVATRLQRGHGAQAPIASARARLKTASGIWLTIEASKLVPANTAVVLAPTRPAELAPLIMRAYEFTTREAELARLVLIGMSTKEIGATLKISELTVQQHLKSIFEKTGIRTRRELAAQIFASHYEPRLREGRPVDASGYFSQ